MIAHYRNKALKKLGLSVLFFVLMFVSAALIELGIPKVIVVLACILLGTFCFVFYVEGSVALAKAKGYDSSVVGAMAIVGFLCGFGLLYMIPLIIYFGLKDKTKHRGFSRRRESDPGPRNPPATLPPLRE